MISLGPLRSWRYYFVDLPLFSCGLAGPRMMASIRRYLEPEANNIRAGYEAFSALPGRPGPVPDTEEVVRKALYVKLVRESDAFTVLKMGRRNIDRFFHVEGILNLKSLRKEKRPVIILTGHYGSFFNPAVAFFHEGFDVYPVARTVDTVETPVSTRIYLTLNYRFAERRFPAGYIYTDFGGWIQRKIISVLNQGGILWSAIDLPRRLYPAKRLPVTFLGLPSSLPSGLVAAGLKRGAIFLTAWSSVETDGNRPYRRLVIDEPISGEQTSARILQVFADRLTERVAAQPWQWMALPVVAQYNEGAACQS